jgi:Holliday junction resolvase
MVNKNYIKGRNYEYKIKKLYELAGFTVLRTAGSHGFADLIAVRMETKEVIFIQCKAGKINDNERNRIVSENDYKGHYEISFRLV